MSVRSRLRSFTRAALLRSRSEREVDAELEFHLTARTDDLIASGLSPAAARERARRELGDARRWQEAARESRGLAWLDGLRSDARFAYRQLRRSGTFATGAILSMALAIGANTAVFSLVNAVLIERLPVRDPGALVLLGVTSDAEALGSSFPYPFYRQLRDSRAAPAGVLASASMRPNLEDGAAAEPVTGELVSGNYFDVLGVQPYLGRLISETDEQTRAAVIVLDYGYWLSRYGGDRTVVGRSVRLNRQPMTIIGVTPPEFHGIEPGASPRLRVPITLQAAMHGGQARLESPREWWLQIIGRVKPGISRPRATEALGREYEHFVAQLPAPYDRTQRLELIDGSHGRPTLQRQFRKPLMVLTGLVAIVLILVCVNVGNLMLARGTTRQREMSLRLALGASRLRILRQLIVEALVPAVAGGTLGLWLSIWGARALAILSGSPPGVAIPIDLRVLTFATLTTVLTGVLCGLAPAWSSRRANLVAALKVETAQITRDRLVGRQLLVAGQIALSLVLVVGAVCLRERSSIFGTPGSGLRRSGSRSSRSIPGWPATRRPGRRRFTTTSFAAFRRLRMSIPQLSP